MQYTFNTYTDHVLIYISYGNVYFLCTRDCKQNALMFLSRAGFPDREMVSIFEKQLGRSSWGEAVGEKQLGQFSTLNFPSMNFILRYIENAVLQYTSKSTANAVQREGKVHIIYDIYIHNTHHFHFDPPRNSLQDS